MRILMALLIIGLSIITLSQALAIKPGDMGTEECREIQLQIQDTVEMEGPYKNHGQLVRAVVNAVNYSKKAKIITGNCASCIIKQFARRIPIERQRACGPDIETEACCFSDGSCEEITSQDCTEIEGTPQGIGTDCTTVLCISPETVACCLIDDVCEDLTPEDCDAKRGVPGDLGSQCSPFYCVSPN